ncbi:MAG: NAD(+) diphosphatase [Candidatus Vecturithrix sp.]|jgi:NAD+ diphosphatase|nr:NAD(+) diphosphatase [Candidatus Vecturithrix sp.]
MPFTSSVIPLFPQHESAWWFIFRENELLVRLTDEHGQIPKISQPEQLSLHVLRTQYLGQLDGIPCFSAEAETSEQAAPEGMAFRALRPLYNVLPDELFWIAGRAFQIMDWDRNSQYCGRCGHQTTLLEGQRAKACPYCQLTIYPRISPAVIVAVIKEQQILLAHAPRFPQGFYSVIAGFVEPGETFEDCVHREVREEVGIEVADIRYFGNQPWPFPDSLMVGFTARYAGGEITVDHDEILEAGWFRADKLPEIPGKVSIARKLIDWFVENYS